MKKGSKKKIPSDNRPAETNRSNEHQQPAYTQNIPDDQIWTYQVEGLPKPHIGHSYKHERGKKALVIVFLLIAISLSMYFSIRTVHNDEFQFDNADDGGYALVRYANPGDTTDLTIDYVDSDPAKPITSIEEFALNCDEKIITLTIGKEVREIDSKAFYSCWSLQNIYVDDENPYYCDLDGVLYTKDMTRIVLYPIDHDKYLREKTGFHNLVDDNGEPMEELWGVTDRYDEAFFKEYNLAVRTYVLPSTVETIGELAFGYANITDLYIPEGVRTIESMAVFKGQLANLYTYRYDSPVIETTYSAVSSLKEIYPSFPDGLESIGSDAFSYNRGLTFVYIPSSVTSIGHHAFWDTVYKEDGELRGVKEIYIQASKDEFHSVDTGDQWRPKYDYLLFTKSVDLVYSSERASV